MLLFLNLDILTDLSQQAIIMTANHTHLVSVLLNSGPEEPHPATVRAGVHRNGVREEADSSAATPIHTRAAAGFSS